MPLERITDLEDPRLAPFRHLKKSNETRGTRFIAEGDKLVQRLLDSPIDVESILLSDSYVEPFRSLLPSDRPTYVIDDSQVETLVGFNFHRGVLACGRRPPSPRLDRLVETERFVLVVCPDVQNPENLGAIVRLAAGFGVVGLVLGPRSADPFSRRVQRVSMGSVYRMPIVQAANVAEMLAELRVRRRIESWAAVLDDRADVLGSIARPERLALVLGSEGHGLSADVIAACDRRVTIPMRSDVDSFNVAVAAGIFLYEVMR